MHAAVSNAATGVAVAELIKQTRAMLGAGEMGVIWAQASGVEPGWEVTPGGGAIGRRGEMPWHVPVDLTWFQQITGESAVIMGRRTWESLPERFRPLPGRRNIVVTRQAEKDALAQPLEVVRHGAAGAQSVAAFNGAVLAPSIEAAQALVKTEERVWVIGGGQLYKSALPQAKVAVVSQFALAVPDADTWAPQLEAQEWQLVAVSESVKHPDFGVRFSVWRRINNPVRCLPTRVDV